MKNELEYSKMLEKTGLSREQAEVHLKVIEGAMQENFASKFDLSEAKNELKAEIQEVRSELKHEIQELRIEFKSEIHEVRSEFKTLEHRLVNKMGWMMAASTGVLTSVVALLKFAF